VEENSDSTQKQNEENPAPRADEGEGKTPENQIREKPMNLENYDDIRDDESENIDGEEGYYEEDGEIGERAAISPITPGAFSAISTSARGLANEQSYIDQARDAKKHIEDTRKGIISLSEKDLSDPSQRVLLEKTVTYLNACIALEKVLNEAEEAVEPENKMRWSEQKKRAVENRNALNNNPGERALRILMNNSATIYSKRRGIGKAKTWSVWNTERLLEAIQETQKLKKR
jgi:hypothetical protein